MAGGQNRKLVEDYMKAWTKADASTLNRLLDDDFKFNNPPPGITPDKEGAVEMSQMFRTAFPDMTIRVEKWVEQGDDVAFHAIATGTHKGEFMGVDPTNKRATTEIVSIVTVRGGKVVQDITVFDALGLMTQIGAIPEMTPPSR